MNAAIPTSKRPEMCNYVANSLIDYENVYVFINNCDAEKYLELEWNTNVRIFNLQISGNSKECHNLTFRFMIDYLPISDTLFIEDDVEISQSFLDHFQILFNLFEHDDKKNGFSLAPIYIPEKKCHYTPEYKEFRFGVDLWQGNYSFERQRYIDGNFAITANVLKHFKSILESTKFPVLKSNSGISPVLSKEMYKMGFPMWVVIPSLLGHGDHESLQFPEGRKRVPLIAKI